MAVDSGKDGGQMKTSEEMAEEYADLCVSDAYYAPLKAGFLAGYKAAENHFRDVTKLVEPQWISVEDRLPEDGQTVIYRISVVTPNGNGWKLDYGEWDANEQTFFGEFLDHRELGWDFTHWMELPAAPKEEK